MFPIPLAADLTDVFEMVRVADEGGLDLVGVQDHPYQKRYVDTFTLMTAIAVRTRNVRVFPDVASLPLRPPGVLAKQAVTIDLLSDGRFEFGLGAGSFWEAISAIGGPRRTPGEALQALSEAIDVIRLMWSDERSVRYAGDHYQLSGVKPGPPPAHDIGIWLGVYGPRAIRLLGEKADGWVPSLPSMPVETLVEKNAAIDEAAIAAGRDPAAIRRVANVNGVITDSAVEGYLRGPVDQWVSQLTELVEVNGMDSFVFWPDGEPIEQTQRFVDVAAATRAVVQEARG